MFKIVKSCIISLFFIISLIFNNTKLANGNCPETMNLKDQTIPHSYKLTQGYCETQIKTSQIQSNWAFISVYVNYFKSETGCSESKSCPVTVRFGFTMNGQQNNTLNQTFDKKGYLFNELSMEKLWGKIKNHNQRKSLNSFIIFTVPSNAHVAFTLIVTAIFPCSSIFQHSMNTQKPCYNKYRPAKYCIYATQICDSYINCPEDGIDEKLCTPNRYKALTTTLIFVLFIISLGSHATIFLILLIKNKFAHQWPFNMCFRPFADEEIKDNTSLASEFIPLPPPIYRSLSKPSNKSTQRIPPPTYSEMYEIGVEPTFIQKLFSVFKRQYSSGFKSETDGVLKNHHLSHIKHATMVNLDQEKIKPDSYHIESFRIENHRKITSESNQSEIISHDVKESDKTVNPTDNISIVVPQSSEKKDTERNALLNLQKQPIITASSSEKQSINSKSSDLEKQSNSIQEFEN